MCGPPKVARNLSVIPMNHPAQLLYPDSGKIYFLNYNCSRANMLNYLMVSKKIAFGFVDDESERKGRRNRSRSCSRSKSRSRNNSRPNSRQEQSDSRREEFSTQEELSKIERKKSRQKYQDCLHFWIN